MQKVGKAVGLAIALFFPIAVARHPVARTAPPVPSSASAPHPLARARPRSSRLTRAISVEPSMPPAPRPIRGTSETKCSRRPPSHDDTDVVGWRRVSCWWRRLRVTTIIAGAAPNPRRRPIATNKPSTPAAGDHLHCHTERRTRCWRRSSTPAGRSRMLVAVHGLAVRSASDATRAPLTAVVETGVLSRATPWLAPRRQCHHRHRRPTPSRARDQDQAG